MYCLELSILLHRALEGRVETLMNNLSVPQWETDPEGLHEVRVASRRVRAVLDLVQPGLYPGYKRQCRKLKDLTRALGRPREMDVHVAILEELGARVPGLTTCSGMEHALEVIERRRRKARRTMARELAGLSLKNLPQMLQVPSLPDPFRAGDLTGTIWNCLEPWLEGAFPGEALLDQEDALAMHALRIRVKRLRYALEVLGPGFPAPPEAQLKHLRALQTALGSHHDRATLEALLDRLHQGLRGRGRAVLAMGIQDVLVHITEERVTAFEQFRALGVGTPKAAFVAELRRDLGLESGGADTP
ncbi:MAG: CHAD domain-containing protein [Holophaga sp.]|nr:CHAD domain-containing protein [Holophaga sp.]